MNHLAVARIGFLRGNVPKPHDEDVDIKLHRVLMIRLRDERLTVRQLIGERESAAFSASTPFSASAM